MVEEFEETKEDRTERVVDAKACSAKRMPSSGCPLKQCEFPEIVIRESIPHDLGDFWIFQFGSDLFQTEFDGIGMGELDAHARVEGDRESCNGFGATAERKDETGSAVVLTVGNP